MKFYKYGIEVFNGSYDKYGGHWQRFNKLLNLIGLHWYSLSITICKWQVEKTEPFYHDGAYHKGLYMGFIVVSWESSCE